VKAQLMLELIVSMLLVISSVLFLIPAVHFQGEKLTEANVVNKQSVLEAYCNVRFVDGNGFKTLMVFDSKASMQDFECLSPKVEKTQEGVIVGGEEPWF